MVVDATRLIILLWVLVLASQLALDVLAYSLVLHGKRGIVDHIEVSRFLPLVLRELLAIHFDEVLRGHWELGGLGCAFLISKLLAGRYERRALL